ncbi:MAG TPA: response regulator [Polyangiaceae bacterium]|jgi:DNA-binding response OmpR family regulator
MSSDEKRPLGKILLQRKLVSQQELEAALRAQKRAATPEPLASVLVNEGTVDEIEALRALSEQHGVPGIDLTQVAIVLEHLDVVPREVADTHRILPVLMRGDRIFMAMADPHDKRVIDELEFVTGKKVYPYIAVHSTLTRTIAEAYEAKARGEKHFLGPRVPEETLRQLGLAGPTSAPVSAPAPVPAPAPAPAPAAPAPPPAPARAAPPLPKGAPGAKPPPPAPARPAAPQAPSFPQTPAPAPSPPAAAAPPARPRPAPPGPGPMRPKVPTSPPRESLVLDQGLQASSETTEVSTSEFGAIGQDISSVTNLPDELRVGTATAADAVAVGGGKLILVVDDEEDIRKLLKRLLTQKGHRVIEADRGLLALRLVKDHVPDLIILDAMLPELHGFDIARRIKGSAKYGRIPIIMVSAVYRGWRIAEDLKQNYGIEEYLEKPFRISDVLEAVQRMLTRDDAKPAEPKRDPEFLSSEAEKALEEGIAAYKAGQTDQAIEHLKRGVGIDPLAYRLHFHLALLYGKQGKVYEGIQELERAIDLNPKHFAALKNLAVLYEKAGFKNKAVEMWERCASMAPDEPTRASIREHLVKLI